MFNTRSFQLRTHAAAVVPFPLLFRSMRGAVRVVAPLFAASSRLSPALAPFLPRNPPSPLRRLLSALPPMSNHSPAAPPPSAGVSLLEPSSFEKQFEDFRFQLEESGNIRERIRAVVMEVEAAVRLMHSSLLLVHHAVPNSGSLYLLCFNLFLSSLFPVGFGSVSDFFCSFIGYVELQKYWTRLGLRSKCWRQYSISLLIFCAIAPDSITGEKILFGFGIALSFLIWTPKIGL